MTGMVQGPREMQRHLLHPCLGRGGLASSTRRASSSSTASRSCHSTWRRLATAAMKIRRPPSSLLRIPSPRQLRTISSSSSSSLSSPSSSPDYSLDDGVVEGVWIFSRHGDRSPGRCLVPAHRRIQEAAYWVSKLPHPDSTAAYQAYSRYFPLRVVQPTNEGTFLDTRRNPYGFLSQKGLVQLKTAGHDYFDRYNCYGRHLPGQGSWKWEKASDDFLAAWNVHAFSTNYLRTVLSAQSFLDGLLGTHCFSPAQERTLDPNYYEERNLPNHDWKHNVDHTSTVHTNTPPLVQVTVRALHKDPLNAFDRNPKLISELVGQVMTSTEFQKRDAAAAPLAARLANVLPGTYV